MNEKMMFLESSIREDLDAIAQLYTQLPDPPLHPTLDEDTVIGVAYRLHNIYNAFENIFQSIAANFENSIEDNQRWHAELLKRMRLNVMPIRPQVINSEAFDALDELRRFRHIFRHAYAVQLDPYRLNIVLQKAKELEAIYLELLEAFIGHMKGVE